jgi:hypothetical protein
VSNVGTISVEELLPQFQHSGGRNYVGRHRLATTPPLPVRAARRIADEWTKPRAWTTALGNRAANSLNDRQAERLYDFVTGETFREAARTIGTTWRSIDRAAYGTLPATWRHRLETAARTRRERDQQRDDTESWWISRKPDYPILIDTQTMPIIRERTPTP